MEFFLRNYAPYIRRREKLYSIYRVIQKEVYTF
jgi:hypothetical protein